MFGMRAAHADRHTPACSRGFSTALAVMWPTLLSPPASGRVCTRPGMCSLQVPGLPGSLTHGTGHWFFPVFSRKLCFSFYLLRNRQPEFSFVFIPAGHKWELAFTRN